MTILAYNYCITCWFMSSNTDTKEANRQASLKMQGSGAQVCAKPAHGPFTPPSTSSLKPSHKPLTARALISGQLWLGTCTYRAFTPAFLVVFFLSLLFSQPYAKHHTILVSQESLWFIPVNALQVYGQILQKSTIQAKTPNLTNTTAQTTRESNAKLIRRRKWRCTSSFVYKLALVVTSPTGVCIYFYSIFKISWANCGEQS